MQSRPSAGRASSRRHPDRSKQTRPPVTDSGYEALAEEEKASSGVRLGREMFESRGCVSVK